MSHETGTLASVTVSEALGHQDFDLLAHQFVPLMTEHPFGLSIHPNDLAILIENDDGIGCGLQKAAELPMDLPTPEQGLDAGQQIGGFDRMRQVGFVPPFQMTGELTALDRGIRQVQHGNSGGGGVGLKATADLEAAHVGQAQFEDNDVRYYSRCQAKPFRTGRGVSDFETCFLEGLFNGAPTFVLGADDQGSKHQ
jgi:hypothetical protein